MEVHHDNKLLISGRTPLKHQPRQHRGWDPGVSLSYPKITDVESFQLDDEGDIPSMLKRLQAFINHDNEQKKIPSADIEYIHKISLNDFAIHVSKTAKDPAQRQELDFSLKRELYPFIGDTEKVSKKLNSTLHRAIYLSGLREEPTREARLAQSMGNRIGIKGEDLATMLHQRRNNKEFMDQFNSHLQVLGIAEKATTTPSYMKSEGKEVETGFIKILLEKQGTTRTLMDLGFGTSQVLPVVFELGLRKKRLILIEQPELHLHPAAQSEIGSLLKFSIEQDNQLIVETHSANLIERLRRLIRKGELDKNDVNIIYIGTDEESGGSRCDVIGFDEKGEFTETWPEESFFGERELEYLDW
jgi:AAA15 family ATPase/GTPase